MKSISKQYYFLLLTILIVSIPNVLLVFVGEDSVVASNLKKIVFFAFSIAVIILPLIVLKPKYYAWISVLIAPIILFEIFNVYTFKAPSSEEAIASIFYTNVYEGTELFKGNLKYGVLFLILLISLIIFSIKLKSSFRLTKKLKLTIFMYVFLVFSVIFIRDYKIAKQSERGNSFTYKMDFAYSLFNVKLRKIFPTGNFKKLISVKKGMNSIKNYQNTIKDFRFNATKKDTLKQQEIYVLVIGETARKENFNLYNYSRNTNPELSKQQNLIAYSNVNTAANLTSISLPFIVTRATPNNQSPNLNEPAIINAFKESGFKTYWITNQAAGLDNVFAFYSRLADYYKNIAVSIDVAKYDEDLFPELDVVLADNSSTKKFIIIHTLGSHYKYNYRYPTNFEVFKPTLSKTLSLTGNSIKLKQETINSYDNSILYTDFVLSEIIKRIEKTNSLSYLYYISDHGENLYDDANGLLMHGFLNPTKYEIEIPLIIWSSDLYNEIYPTKRSFLEQRKQQRISTTNTFQTLLDLANITYKEENLKLSFANKDFDSIQPRYLLTTDKKVLKLD